MSPSTDHPPADPFDEKHRRDSDGPAHHQPWRAALRDFLWRVGGALLLAGVIQAIIHVVTLKSA